MSAGAEARVIAVATDGPAGAGFTTRIGGVSGGPFASLNLGPDRTTPMATSARTAAARARRSGSTPTR